MQKNDFEDLSFCEMDLIKTIAIQALRRGYKGRNNLGFSLEPRYDNGVITSSLCCALREFCESSNNWFYLADSQNNYLIYKSATYACVFKIRNSNPIDTQNLRNNLSNGRLNFDQNANVYIANDVVGYLNKPRNSRLKELLNEYRSDQIYFFHLVWSLSENEVDHVHVGVTYTYGYVNNNQDWYLHLISDTIIQEQTKDSQSDVLVNVSDNILQKANVIKPKRLGDDQGKQSV